MTKKLYLLRGVSGCGKSYLAGQLVGNTGVILSTDDFFMNPATGNYDYNNQSLPKAHYWNQVRARMMMERDITPIIIDNTNLSAWEAHPYVVAAEKYDYEVQILEPDNPWKHNPELLLEKTKHKVELAGITQQLSKLISEPYTLADAMKAVPPKASFYNLDSQEKKKVERNLASKIDSFLPSGYSAPSSSSSQNNNNNAASAGPSTIKVEVAKNDGQKSMLKPIVVKSDDFDVFLKLACNQLRLKQSKQTRVYTTRGEPITRVDQFTPNLQLVVSERGDEFVPIALKKTAAEKRAIKMQQNQEAMEQKLEAMNLNSANTNANNINESTSGKAILPKHFSKLPLGISEIVEGFLYLGSARDAHTEDELKKYNITHILNVAADCPPSRVSGIISKHVKMWDEINEDLDLHFPQALEFIQTVHATHVSLQTLPDEKGEQKEENEQREKQRILVHCAVGRSRSAAVVMAFMMVHLRMPLYDAFVKVKTMRDTVLPNVGFMRQLMKLDKKLHSTLSLNWHQLPDYTTNASVVEWLRNSAVAGPPTHMWWEVLTKEKFNVPIHFIEELYTFTAAAISKQEPVKLVELRGPVYKFHIDLDIKTKCFDWSEREFLDFFLDTILAIVNSEISGKTSKFTVTSSFGYYATRSHSEVRHKYGYHLIWHDLVVDRARHYKILSKLKLECEGRKMDKIPKEVLLYNTWEEIFDVQMLESENGLRMVYSEKSVSCRACEKRDKANKKAKVKRSERDEDCVYCKGSGLLPPRVHTFLGVFKHTGELDLETQTSLSGVVPLERIWRELMLSSIIIPSTDELQDKKEMQEVEWSGVVIDKEDQVRILQLFDPPAGWSADADHMTICMGPLSPTCGVTLGDRVECKISKVGSYNKELIALLVESKVVCDPGILPHITVSHSPQTPPKLSNYIQTWTELDATKAISVWGTVQEKIKYSPHKVTRSDEAKEGKERKYELAVVDFLRKYGEEALIKTYKLKAARHKKYTNLVQFSYSQVGSNFAELVVQESRGIVLDSKANWAVVAFPYTKFFNFGEERAADIDWSSAVVYDKVDGSAVNLYYYGGEWHVASSSLPDGSGSVSKTHSVEIYFGNSGKI